MAGFEAEGLDHVAFNVMDVARSARWYREVLGLERRYGEAWGEVSTMLCKGGTCIALFPAEGEASGR